MSDTHSAPAAFHPLPQLVPEKPETWAKPCGHLSGISPWPGTSYLDCRHVAAFARELPDGSNEYACPVHVSEMGFRARMMAADTERPSPEVLAEARAWCWTSENYQPGDRDWEWLLDQAKTRQPPAWADGPAYPSRSWDLALQKQVRALLARDYAALQRRVDQLLGRDQP